jgi:hypothetical protein
MFQTAYLSSAPTLLTGNDIEGILSVSRTNNQRLGLTGMLLYQQGNFLQILEGEREALDTLMGVIAADPRHRGIIRLFTHEIETRDFPDWTMGFREFAADADELQGFSDILDPSFDMGSFAPSRAATLLKVFKTSHR